MNTVIEVSNLSKVYRLGQINTGTLSQDISRSWALIRGKEDPYLRIGETNDRTIKGESDFVWSLKDINFTVEAGEAIGIIGRNGAGKSTLLKILSQITAPTTGSVKVKGRIASLLEVGTGFHPELTGRENIFLNGAILGMRKKEIIRKFDEIVDFSGVERYIDTPVKRYSSGMYVRLAFAVAAHLESEILIVDEVLAVGDSEFQKKCLGKMGDVSKGEGRTVLFVSHNLASIKAFCSRGIYLKDGLIESVDKINSLIKLYKQSTNGVLEMDANTALDKRIDRCSSSGRQAGFLRISAFRIKDEENNDCIVFKTNSIIIFELEFEVFENIQNFGLYINFQSNESFENVTSNFFEITKQAMLKGFKGKLEIKFSDLPLQPGDYLPYIVASSLGREPYDVIDRLVFNVPIIEISSDGGTLNKYPNIPAKFTLSDNKI